jgi:hypothetical protein
MGRPILVALLVLAGCASQRHWTKPGGTEAELNAAKNVCENQANARFPALWIRYQDVNRNARNDAIDSCLRAAGWQH